MRAESFNLFDALKQLLHSIDFFSIGLGGLGDLNLVAVKWPRLIHRHPDRHSHGAGNRTCARHTIYEISGLDALAQVLSGWTSVTMDAHNAQAHADTTQADPAPAKTGAHRYFALEHLLGQAFISGRSML
jgi:hypothetical protein